MLFFQTVFEACSVFSLLLRVALHRKLRKATTELADKMGSLSLDELGPNESKNSPKHILSQVENVFSFTTADSSTFPKSHCQEFVQLTERLPKGTMCDGGRCCHVCVPNP